MRGMTSTGLAAALTAVAMGATLVAAPAEAVIPPPPVQDLTAVAAHRQVALTWTVPADPDIDQVVVRRRQGTTPPATPTAGTAVFAGVADSVVDTGLTNGVRYSYSVWTQASDTTYSTAFVTASATPKERVTVRAGLQVSDRSITYGQRVTFTGELVRQASDKPVTDEELQLLRRTGGGDPWRVIERGTTGGQGKVTWQLRPQTNAEFRVRHLATPVFAAATSADRGIAVRPKLRASLSKDWARQTGTVKIRGQVKPGLRDDRVVLERKVAGRWRAIDRANPDAEGKYQFGVSGWAARDTYRYRVVVPETEQHQGVRSASMSLDVVRVVTYRIETRGKIVTSLATFRERAAAIYADPRGWSRAYVRFQRVKTGGDFSLVLSEARYVPTFAPICDRYWSCRVGRYVIINQNRWRWGTPYFKGAGGSLSEYRAMVVNHETGHWFGLGHATCTKSGAPAPVMMQQSKGLYGCEPNPWPLRGEIARVN